MPLPERQLIRLIERLARPGGGTRAAFLRQGMGDDCAVLRLPAGTEVLVTTDFTLEDVHFRRAWHPAAVVGHRCLARGLSDLAAMGGKPLAAFLSLALPAKLEQRWVTGFLRGFLKLARGYGVILAGGDISQSASGILADVMVLGAVPRGRAILRSGARPGDLLYVTGTMGGSTAALEALRRGARPRASAPDFARHFWPEPRVAVGAALRHKKLATAMIDLSDGLSTDLSHICEQSGVGAVLYSEVIPRARFGGESVSLELALHGGEDYELLFAARPSVRIPDSIAGTPVTRIGQVISRRGMWLAGANGKLRPFPAAGWQHFSE